MLIRITPQGNPGVARILKRIVRAFGGSDGVLRAALKPGARFAATLGLMAPVLQAGFVSPKPVPHVVTTER